MPPKKIVRKRKPPVQNIALQPHVPVNRKRKLIQTDLPQLWDLRPKEDVKKVGR